MLTFKTETPKIKLGEHIFDAVVTSDGKLLISVYEKGKDPSDDFSGVVDVIFNEDDTAVEMEC